MGQKDEDMDKCSRDDVVMSLRRLEHYIQEMDDEKFQDFLNGQYVNSMFMRDQWSFSSKTTEDINRNIVRLGVRIF